MAEFVYVSRNERKQAKLDLIELIKCVQNEVRDNFTFRFDFIGSEPLNMVTRDLKSNVGYDFDVNLEVNDKDENYSAEEIRRIIRLAFDKYNRFFDYDYCEDSSRVLTIKVKDRENSRIIHSCDFAIVRKINNQRQEFIKFQKLQNRYIWNRQPNGYKNQQHRIDRLKKNGYWQKVLDLYLDKKNNNVKVNKKSRHLRAEAINEVYQWYFEK